MIVKRVNILIKTNVYNELQDFFNGKQNEITAHFHEHILVKINNIDFNVNITFYNGLCYFCGRTDISDPLKFSTEMTVKNINDIISTFNFKFELNDKSIDLYINIDREYDSTHFENIIKYYKNKLESFYYKIKNQKYYDLYNYLVYSDFNKNIDIMYGCYIVSVFIAKFGLKYDFFPHIKLFFEKLEHLGITEEVLKNAINSKELNIRKNIEKLEVEESFLDKEFFEEAIYTLIAVVFIYNGMKVDTKTLLSIKYLDDVFYYDMFDYMIEHYYTQLGE